MDLVLCHALDAYSETYVGTGQTPTDSLNSHCGSQSANVLNAKWYFVTSCGWQCQTVPHVPLNNWAGETVPASMLVETVSTIYLFYARYVFGKIELPVMCSYISIDSWTWTVYTMFCLSSNLWTFLWRCDFVFQTYVEIICLPKKCYTRSITNICLKVLLTLSGKDTESIVTFSQKLFSSLAFCFALDFLLL